MITALLWCLSWLASLGGEGHRDRLAAAGGALWWHVLRYRRGVILTNLRQAFPERSEAERARLGAQAARHLVGVLLDFLRIPRHVRAGFREVVRVEGLEHLAQAKAQGRGVLCLSGHLGSFELAVAAVAREASPVHLVVKPFPPGVERFVGAVRRRAGLGLIPAEGAVRPILRALKANETVVFVLDQNATRAIGVFVDFFGKPACTMSALATLAVRSRTPVIAATIHREGRGHVLTVHPAIPLEEQGDAAATVRHMTQVYTRFLEAAIRAHPAEWFWTHKRWRTRPLSTPGSGEPAA